MLPFSEIGVFELVPMGSQKSFYGKAKVQVDKDGRKTLWSYNTPIMDVFPDGSMARLWDGWTATTGKHIAAFCGMNKKEFLSLPLSI